jgi:hypothetical protein
MQRLRDVRQWREQFGMGTSGGPVRVAPTDVAVDEPGLAETAVATPDPANADPRDPENPQRGGIASPDGASVEISFDWE